MKRATGQWLQAAEDDLRVAAKIISDDYLTHAVAFHCQQCVEKCLKAVLEEHGERVPKEHSTLKLYGLARQLTPLAVNVELLTDLDDLYIDARYPSELGLLPTGKPTVAEAREFYDCAKSIHDQVMAKL
jgi:HEPN domain-containing protein